MVNRGQQTRFVDPEIAGQQFPGKGDRVGFEIITETEITQHFEKRVVARGIADIVQIIMLATGAHAFLAGGGAAVIACFDPCEQVLELHHARIGEHQCRVIARHKRARRDHTVALFFEIIQKSRTDVSKAGHGALSRKISISGRNSGATGRCPPIDRITRSWGCVFFTKGRVRAQPELRPFPYISTISSSAGPSLSLIANSRPWAARILSSISFAILGFSLRNSLEFSRPCPIRSSP